MTKRINPGMFTKDNAAAFWGNVERRGQSDCWTWKGPKARYRQRVFGIFRVRGCGYVMNQRFVYITENSLPESEHGIKVRPAPNCTLGELCCNPNHIVELRSGHSTGKF